MSFRRFLPMLAAMLPAVMPLLASAQEAPPTFEEAAPAAAGSAPSFRMSYPVRDAASGQTFTEQRATAPADVPSAVSDTDLAAGLAMPDPGPAPQSTSPAMSEAAADAAFETVGSVDSYTQELTDPGPFRSGSGPFRYSFYVTEGYNSNVNGQQNGGVQSMFTSIGASVGYTFGTSRLEIELGLGAGLTFYYNNKGLQNNGLFPTGVFDLGVQYAVSDRLNLFLDSSTSLLSQPDFALVGGSNNYQGDYIVSATTFGVSYRWLPKFETITSYAPVIWYYFEPEGDNFSRFDQTVAQQFLFLWKPVTSLVAEYRFNTRNYWYIDNYNSIGNYALLGFNHQLNPRSEVVFRAGAEQRINQIPNTGGTYNYIGPFGELRFNYSLRPKTDWTFFSRYGTSAASLDGYNQDQQFLLGTGLSHEFGKRLVGNIFLNYQHNYYDQPDNGTPDFYTNVFQTGLSAQYNIYGPVWLNAGYTYAGVISSDDAQQNSYNQNVVFLGAQLNF